MSSFYSTKNRLGILWLALATVLFAACTPAGPRTLTLMTHDSFAISDEVLAEFEAENNAQVEILRAGDAGAALNQAILSKDNPLGDVFFGVDNTFFSRALEADIFLPYRPAGLDKVPDEFELDPQYRLVPIDYGDVCLNYDKDYFAAQGLPVPQSLRDLTDPAYRGLLVVENPATSSPGLAFLLATLATFGETGDYTYLDFWADLRENDILVTDGWETAYFTEFTRYGGGRPIVVSYATSPPAEVFFSEGALTDPPTASILAAGSCFRQIEFAGVLKGTGNQDLAQKFIDYMLSLRFQEDIPLNMFVFPVNEEAQWPE
ncbi:MAG: thiamine ABC transporter substrate-binding protein, partial [Chloroflexi bacterium]|nr:thiamine ABC transporter substrate-binding protein [Chloroflexota bacterium]